MNIEFKSNRNIFIGIQYLGPEYDNLGCWKFTEESTIPKLENSLLDVDYSLRKDAIKKCYLFSKSLGYKVFALKDGGDCLSSANSEDTYDRNGISTECETTGKGGTSSVQVYKIGNVWI